MVQRNCELFCQIVLFYAAHAVSDGGSNHWDIFWKGKSFSLHQKLNWRDGRLIISDSDCCLISDGDSNHWNKFWKGRSCSNTCHLLHSVEAFSIRIIFCLHWASAILKRQELFKHFHIHFHPFHNRIIFCLLTLRFCIQRSWGLCAILLYPTSRPHSYPLSQTSWLPVK